MFAGSDLARLLKERLPAAYLNISGSEEDNNQHAAPSLAAYLTLLNDLAKNDLNFQNLLVLKLLSLGVDFGENRPSDDHRFMPWERRRNCLTELVDSFGKHKPQEERGHSMSCRTTHDDAKQVLETTASPTVVVGYPAADFQYAFQHPNGGMWDPSTQVYGQDDQLPYCHGEWMTSHWRRWKEEDARAGVGHAGVTWDEVGSSSIEKLDEDVGNGEENTQTYDENELLCKCNSWPESINTLSPEGLPSATQISGDFNSVQDGYLEMKEPFKLEHEAEIDGRSDLERFMEAATPRIPPHDSESQSTDACRSLSMEDVWQFYELPSVYGLQVPFFKGATSVSFAHFVPSLSAIRLFMSASSSSSDDSSHKEIFLCDDPKHPQHMRLEFEFFETEKPHVRRPLLEEIRQLSHVGFAGKLLPNLLLSEIHPSSWFSVAWYPIYCIPEGRLRTSFLTFHSFGMPSNVNNTSGGKNCLEAQLTGIKFTSLGREAWIRSKRPEKNRRQEFQSKLVAEHVQPPRTKNGMELPRHPESGHHPMNGCMDHDLNIDRPRDLEHTIGCLLSNAEKLSRARIRRVASGSGAAVDPHQCYHPDFEFFHQRS